jgi:hypothetical protein
MVCGLFNTLDDRFVLGKCQLFEGIVESLKSKILARPFFVAQSIVDL